MNDIRRQTVVTNKSGTNLLQRTTVPSLQYIDSSVLSQSVNLYFFVRLYYEVFDVCVPIYSSTVLW